MPDKRHSDPEPTTCTTCGQLNVQGRHTFDHCIRHAVRQRPIRLLDGTLVTAAEVAKALDEETLSAR